MEITTKGITMAKYSFYKSNGHYLFHSSPKTMERQLFKHPFIIYVKNCLECNFRKFTLE